MAGVKCPLPELGCYWRFGGKRTGSVTSRCCDFLLARSVCSRPSDWPGMRCFVIVNVNTVLGLAPPPSRSGTSQGVTPVLPSQAGRGGNHPPPPLISLSLPTGHIQLKMFRTSEREGSMIGNNDFKCRHLNKSE